MDQAQLEQRAERARTETFVIMKRHSDFHIYAPTHPERQYVVSGTVDAPQCTCPDFQHHADDPAWRCKHILAVSNETAGNGNGAGLLSQPQLDPVPERTVKVATGTPSRMTLKRSVSPDGRIDSLSVELSLPVAEQAQQETIVQARGCLTLQAAIVEQFLGGVSGTESSAPVDRTAPATLLGVRAMETRFGRRLFMNVQVNGETLKLFGSHKQLAEAIASAGFPDAALQVTEGLELNLPCRVTTKSSDNGQYTNVDQVLPDPARNGR